MTRIHFWKQNTDSNMHETIRKSGDVLPDNAEESVCDIEIPGGGKIHAQAVGNHIFISPKGHSWWFGGRSAAVKSDKPFVTVTTNGNAVAKIIGGNRAEKGGVNGYWFEGQSPRRHWGLPEESMNFVPYAVLPIRVTAEDGTSATDEICLEQPDFGKAEILDGGPEVTVVSDFHGMSRFWKESLAPQVKAIQTRRWWGSGNDTETHVLNNPLEVLVRHSGKSVLSESPDVWWEIFFRHNFKDRKVDDAGIKATLKKKGIKENMERLEKENPVDHVFFLWLFSSKTVDKKKNNMFLAAMLEKVGMDFDALLAALRQARSASLNQIPDNDWHRSESKPDDPWRSFRREICLSLPGAADIVQEQEAKSDWTKRKGNSAQADGIGIDAASFPLLRSAVETGDIPTGVFHQVNKDPVNVEFLIWEKSLGRPGWAEPICAIAKNASGRTTYERDITSFLAFLFKIEKFLERHTGHVWNAVPRFVESQFDLEMNETEDGDGKATVKRRSALTPVADNATHIVTVPYVALSVSGVRTQWCYSRYYHIFEEGFTDPISHGIVVSDLERKLNGRDDYGLCYYTLTGTDTARGYPTFLVIFENLKSGPRVHFHRVRPQRTKNGVPTPACQLVEACYQFMAGNIPASDVAAQQGDLIFIKCSNDPVVAGAKVEDPEIGHGFEFESHLFASKATLRLFRSTAKTPANRLGFLHAEAPVKVDHPEHENIKALQEGWWEIRRCKSWEANPKAIWSRTID